MGPVDALATEGAAALARGDWTGARRHFEAVLEQQETAATLEGLSDALFWLEEIGLSIERRTRACVIYQEAGDRSPERGSAGGSRLPYFSQSSKL